MKCATKNEWHKLKFLDHFVQLCFVVSSKTATDRTPIDFEF